MFTCKVCGWHSIVEISSSDNIKTKVYSITKLSDEILSSISIRFLPIPKIEDIKIKEYRCGYCNTIISNPESFLTYIKDNNLYFDTPNIENAEYWWELLYDNWDNILFLSQHVLDFKLYAYSVPLDNTTTLLPISLFTHMLILKSNKNILLYTYIKHIYDTYNNLYSTTPKDNFVIDILAIVKLLIDNIPSI